LFRISEKALQNEVYGLDRAELPMGLKNNGL